MRLGDFKSRIELLTFLVCLAFGLGFRGAVGSGPGGFVLVVVVVWLTGCPEGRARGCGLSGSGASVS